jgi:hypothetical protein
MAWSFSFLFVLTDCLLLFLVIYIHKIAHIIRNCRKAYRDTQISIRLASYLVRAPNSRSERHELKAPVWWELGALTEVGRSLGSGLLDHIMPDMYVSLADATSLHRHPSALLTSKRGTGWSYVKTQTSIRLASHFLVRAPNSVRPDLFAMEKPPSFLSDPWNKDNEEDHALFLLELAPTPPPPYLCLIKHQ